MVSSLRSQIRQLRRNLSFQQQQSNGFELSQHLASLITQKKFKKIAIYLPNDGEISPLILKQLINLSGVKYYLPVLAQLKFRGLVFAEWSQKTQFKNNKFKISEPITGKRHYCHSSQLDVIFLPLVAFDAQGNRVGMGGGFYDRALQIRQRRPHWRRPLLVGLAHGIQQVEPIQHQRWDIPLDAIATEKGIHYFKNN